MVLKKSEIEAFKNQLIKLRSEYLNQFQVTKNVVKEKEDPKGYSQHSADEGSDDFEKSLSLELSSKDQEIIRQIDRALEKIDEGTYGICDVTNEEIPLKRLIAIPYANMTVKAQEELENNRR